MDQEVLDARAKLAARFGPVQVGGKGKQTIPQFTAKLRWFRVIGDTFNILELSPNRLFNCWFLFNIGSQRRTKKVVHHDTVNEDKKLKSTIKKFGMQSLQDIDEVNMFKDDNTVIHLKKPQSKWPHLS